MHCERGQTTIEWTGLALVLALALGALAAVVPRVDGRSFGGFMAHRIVCAVRGGCDDGDTELARAYGKRDAARVRELAPGLVYEPGEPSIPVDFRDCRRTACSKTPNDRLLDAHRTEAGARATVFTHVVHRDGRTYIQYWLYYPDSNSTALASDKLWYAAGLGRFGRYPGFHRDDWESFQLRIDPDGRVWARASAHDHYQGCKQTWCKNRWTRHTGWTRVSRGSHAGHVPLSGDRRERTTTSDGLRLVPLETLPRRGRYRPLDRNIKPPWRKGVWRDPSSNGT